LRATPIAAVVLTNADVDHIAGLLSLRERQPFALYATRRVLEVLEENPIFKVLDPAIVPRRELATDGACDLRDAADVPTGLTVEGFAIPGKVALYLEDLSRPDADYGSEEGDTIALRIRSREADAAAFYIPGCARISADLLRRLDGADCLLFDGTVYTDDEMITAGVGQKTGARMGHIAMSGENGSVAGLAEVAIGRRVFVHINNTNPVLDEASRERRAVTAAGWEVAHDGMEITL
ncbi:pyrroloquinoline quinone biosynthesis protein PqqB, partial [Nitratireductor sp. GCM10026969]|uniref:pyrroloquinoline quinone biosynthesis protein PqqB n=1 Tax=Nitratireductor sp. GCM10026969 TaxID=3252645 RepID=UPI00361A3935